MSYEEHGKLKKEPLRVTEPFIYKSGGKRRAIVSIRISSTRVRNTKVGSSCNVQLFDSLTMKFRQLLALCYHYLVSDQDSRNAAMRCLFLKWSVSVYIKWLCSKYLRQTRWKQLYYDLSSIVYVTQASRFKIYFFFLEVRLGCGSSTKIKTADIQRTMCATVVTLKKA